MSKRHNVKSIENRTTNYHEKEKNYLKERVKYALPEATIGAKWQCVWNGVSLYI